MLRSLALDVRKCVPAISVSRRDGTAGAHGNHQQQAQAKSAYGCGQNKCADAERSTDLPDELLAGGRATHAGNRYAILHHDSERGREQSHSGTCDERRSDDPTESMFKCDHEKEKSQNVDNNSNHTRKSFADSMDQSSSAEGERAPSNGERANHQAYERAIVMKSGGEETQGQISTFNIRAVADVIRESFRLRRGYGRDK